MKPTSYAEVDMRKPKFKVGNKVRVLRASTDEEHDLWGDSWVEGMDENIGKVLTIDYIYCDEWQKEYEYCKCTMGESGFAYPEFVLENEIQVGQQLLFDFME